MHHTLKLYGEHGQGVLRLYMFFAKWTRIPLLGRLVRRVANIYGGTMHRAHLLKPTEAEELIDTAEGVAIAPCTCRKLYKNCDNPVDAEILLGPTRHIMLEAIPDDSHEISKDEAKKILRDHHQRGLILTVAKCRGDFYAICSCCSCCCVPLRLSRHYGIGNALIRHQDIVQEFREYQLSLMHEENT
jgi:hypothetical protein